MAWRVFPIITEDKEKKEVVQDQLINLDNIGYFRKWADEGGDGRSVGYSANGKKHVIDIPFEQLVDELNPANHKV